MDHRPRPTTGLTPGSPDARRSAQGAGRNLAASLDSLVRSVRTNPGIIENLVDRTLGYWLEFEHEELGILPAGMRFGGHEVFTAEEEEGRWLLPAFMAGLRALRPWQDIRPVHLQRLVSELSDLSGGVEEIERFRDWLWADGAEGFDVSLDLSFSEGIDTVFDELETLKRDLAAMRVSVAQRFDQRARLGAKGALAPPPLLPELQVDLRAFEAQVDAETFIIPTDEHEELLGLCVDPNFWAEAQAGVVLGHPALQAGISASHLADLLTRDFSRSVDLRVVEFLTSLKEREDPYGTTLLATLETEALGQRLAASTPMTNQGIRTLAGLVVSGPLPIARGAARGFIERATSDRAAFAAMKQIAASVVFPRFCELLIQETLADDARTTLGLLILRSKDPTRLMPRFFEAVPTTVALEVLGQAPAHLLWEARAAVGALLSTSPDPHRRRQLIRILLGTGEDRWLRIIGRSLTQTAGQGWCPATLKATCERLLAGDLGEEYLLPLVQNSAATDDAVIAALRALERNSDVLKEATKFHFRELTQSKDVRQRLRKLRKRLKEEG